MSSSECPLLVHELARRVRALTGGRVGGLTVEIRADRVVLRGRAASFYVKQLAQHGVREILPRVRVDNALAVTGGQASAPAA